MAIRMGDVNRDDVIDADDASLLWNWVAFPNHRGTVYNIDEDAADVNHDGKVDISDSVKLLNHTRFPTYPGFALDEAFPDDVPGPIDEDLYPEVDTPFVPIVPEHDNVVIDPYIPPIPVPNETTPTPTPVPIPTPAGGPTSEHIGMSNTRLAFIGAAIMGLYMFLRR